MVPLIQLSNLIEASLCLPIYFEALTGSWLNNVKLVTSIALMEHKFIIRYGVDLKPIN